jgi:hypothetical protein
LRRLIDGKHNPQRIILEGKLEKYLAEGRLFIGTPPSQRILIKKC